MEEHLLKYMLRWETRDSETLLNPAKLDQPFLLPAAGPRQWREAGADGGCIGNVQLSAGAEGAEAGSV